MPPHDHPSPSIQPAKRQRQSSLEPPSPRSNGQLSPTGESTGDAAAGAPGKAGQSSNFRNVSACNRCRLRKNRCDQRLPSCASCAKAGVACVGYDPITKKEIPRSYVFYLETRVAQLESILVSKEISFPPAENLELCSRPGADAGTTSGSSGFKTEAGDDQSLLKPQNQAVESLKSRDYKTAPGMMNIVSPSKPRSLASASGVSFARVVFAAVQYSVSDQGGAGDRPGSRHPSGSGTSMRDSFFGLHTKPTIQPATFPDKKMGQRLVTLYFEHANPQIPILHRGEFLHIFEQAYADPPVRGPRELYMLNMVFAIGCGVIVGEPVKSESGDTKMVIDQPKNQCQPEEYHASAIVHLEACLSNSGGGLEVLQAVLLLANFALLRPVPPGLWYIIGVAVRLAVDLGLHHEEGGDVDPEFSQDVEQRDGSSERGKRFWNRDMKRRLWWCTYSFDRLVSTCVGRPFGISDHVITTELPSLLDDDYIRPDGFLEPSDEDLPSYKHVAHHYFRLRMLQSEILQVLQYNQAQISRAMGQKQQMYPEMHTHLPSPFLVKFDSFRSWRMDINERLYEWKTSAPTKEETGVAFSTEFLELNYWQAIILLYRQSLSVPALFEGEYNTSNEVNSPNAFTAELREDEDEIYRKVAEAGQKILRIYRQLHLSGLVSYTYLSTHHLFMAGISYLYAIWHSPTVRSHLTMDDVDFTVLAAKSIFSDMIDKCPPAETCRDAFDRTAKATIKMATSNGGFGTPVQKRRPIRRDTSNRTSAPESKHQSRRQPMGDQQPFQQFDLSLSDSLSSPSLSAAGQQSPPLGNSQTFDSDYMRARRDAPPVDPSMVTSPSTRRMPAPGNAYMGQQFGLQGAVDYPDSQTMEFMQNVGATPGGEFGGVDANQMDLGFGLNWEGFSTDFGDGQGQQMNPFDTFFFGGQQGGGGM